MFSDWKRSDKQVLPTNRVKKSDYGRTLEIQNVKMSDKGTYICEAKNTEPHKEPHKVKKEFIIDVKGKQNTSIK